MLSNTFSFALFSAAAVATEWGYQGGYQSYAPRPTYGGYGGYGGYGNYNGYAAQQPQQPQQQSPWAAAAPAVDKSTWVNQYQQYSSPWIAYVPNYSYQAVFALCELDAGNVNIGQLSKQAPIVQAFMTGLAAETEHRFMIRTLGKTMGECANGGEEFNPYKEEWNGQVNPHADPTRGKINGFTTDETGAFTLNQAKLLQNLSGKDSIVGKSIELFQVVTDEDDMSLGCCVIGQDETPAHLVKAEIKTTHVYHKPKAPQEEYHVVSGDSKLGKRLIRQAEQARWRQKKGKKGKKPGKPTYDDFFGGYVSYDGAW